MHDMLPVGAALAAILLVLAAEALHVRRIRRLALLAFGPRGRPATWVRAVPVLRAAAVAALTWGLLTLIAIEPKTHSASGLPTLEESDIRHVLLVIDVSPSMRLRDSGPTGEQSRMQRARDVMESFFRRVPLEQYRITVVAVYNGAKPVVRDTSDIEVVRNILGDLPMHWAFPSGKTRLFDGLEEAARIAKPWNPGSTTVILVSDGDTVPAMGMPKMPAAVSGVLVVGVGDPRTGTFIDGRQSRQEVSTLRQIATRLGGSFHNGNENHLATTLVSDLTAREDESIFEQLTRREYALLCSGAGAALLALLPALLHLLGTGWRPGTRHHRPQRRRPAMKRNLTSTSLILALTVPAWSQTQREIIITPMQMDGTVVITSGAPPTETGAAAAEAGGGSARAKKLKALKFDRRPSAILAAWSTPPEEEDEAESDAVTEPEAEPDTEAEAEEAPESEPAVELTEEERLAMEEAERMAAEAAAEAERVAAEAAALEAECVTFQRDVTLGRWAEVKTYLGGLDEEEGLVGYTQLLASLAKGPPKPKQHAKYAEDNAFGPDDVTGLASAAPVELEDAHLAQLAKILGQCIAGGNLLEDCLQHIRDTLVDTAPPFQRTQVARIVLEAGFPVEAGEFLPDLDEAVADNERSALNLLSRHYLALNARDAEIEDLERAWTSIQAVLADGDVEDEDKQEALKRAVEIAPRLRDALGAAWLEESFTSRPQRGMEILSVIGSSSAKGLAGKAKQADERFKNLELQTTAVNALLEAAPELAADWTDTLNLLATNWLREAEHTYTNDTSTSRGPSSSRDYYGNYFWFNTSQQQNNSIPAAITSDEILEIRPSDAWLDFVHPALRPKCAMIVAQLLLKVNEEADAFPYIELLAGTHPKRAEELVEEFLRVWTTNHDPNKNSRRNRTIYFFGFEQRKNAIPLTRSKQERNLVELADWVARLRALPIEAVDEELLARAFMTAHSTAEVYRLDTIERVFGALDSLEPKTLAQLVQAMRGNLVGVWRLPATQKENNTRRRQKDIQNEVLRGYEVARSVVEQGLAAHPDDWSLALALAAVTHDENNFRAEVAQSSEFAGRRQEAFLLFRKAADLYASQVEDMKLSDESDAAYTTWFYASLGSCDLDAIEPEMNLATSEIGAIRDAMAALPGEASDRHLETFANALFSSMSGVNPGVKYRYVRAGVDIVDDHERAKDARDVLGYYDDLVTEIRFETRVDGSDRVGNGEPFGVYVDIRHTREIEREAGGFSKYLTNQNDSSGFSFNYGRPTENYRDKFEDSVREALQENFEVQSVTFNHPDTHSRADEEYGWRVTPYAYVLLTARAPEIDRVPPLHLDLDFIDTSGYAVLPISSSPLPIDAATTGDRPYSDLHITQTLDERQADKGKLLLEVKATALGLVPALEDIVDLAPDGFDVVTADDHGAAVSEFDQDGPDAIVQSERTWDIELQAAAHLEELPQTFAFATPRVDVTEMIHQRYVDADLANVDAVVPLEASYGETDVGSWPLWGGAFVVLAAAGFYLLRARRTHGEVGPTDRYRVPDTVSPFTVIGLLRDISANNGISQGDRAELARQITDLEGHYFDDDESESPDLRDVAERWVQRAS